MASGPTIVAKFLADTSDLTSGVDKAAGGMNSKLGGFGKSAGKIIGGAFATGAIVQFGKASVDAAGADAEAQAQLARTIRNTTGATDAQVAANEDFISSLSKQTSIADDDLRPAMANLVRGFGNVADAQGALSLATDISAGTGKDLGSVSEALMKAANGQTGALGRLGIETKDGAGKAKSLDQIMGDLSTTFKGQAATAADTAAGRARGAAIAFGELQETIGSGLTPVLTTLAPILSTVAGFLADNARWVVPLAIAFGIWSLAVSVATTATTAFGISLGISVGWIALIAVALAGLAILIVQNWDTIKGAVLWVWDWIQEHWPLLLAILTGPIGAAVILIVQHWDDIKAAAVAVWDWINNTWHQLLDILKKPFEAAKDLIVTAFDGIKGAAVAVWDWLNNTWNQLTDIVAKPIQVAKDLVSTAFGLMTTAAQGVFDGVKGIFDKFAGIFENIVGAVKTAIGHVVDAIVAPINLIISAWNGIAFKIPEITLPSFDTHIPGVGTIGGGTVGGQSFDFPNITPLATGGVLSSPTLFLGGEAGTEIVAPEELLRTIIAEEAGRGSYTLNMYPRTADAADVAYGFKRLELMAGVL